MKLNMHFNKRESILLQFVKLPYAILGLIFTQMVKKFHLFIIAEYCCILKS